MQLELKVNENNDKAYLCSVTVTIATSFLLLFIYLCWNLIKRPNVTFTISMFCCVGRFSAAASAPRFGLREPSNSVIIIELICSPVLSSLLPPALLRCVWPWNYYQHNLKCAVDYATCPEPGGTQTGPQTFFFVFDDTKGVPI